VCHLPIALETATRPHAHDYHQIVIGLAERAELETEGLGGAISALSGGIAPANHAHSYPGSGTISNWLLTYLNKPHSLAGFPYELACLFDAAHFSPWTGHRWLQLTGYRAEGRWPAFPATLCNRENTQGRYSSRWRQPITVDTWHRKGFKGALLLKQCDTKSEQWEESIETGGLASQAVAPS
jgi:hypothetical protein